VLRRLLGDYVLFSTDLGDTTPIDAHPEDLDQLLTSLVTLGRDLLPAGGTMSIRVRQVDSDTEGAGRPGAPGPVLTVRATGYGVRVPGPLAALEFVAQRCGGTLNSGGEAGRQIWIEIGFPRCGMPSKAGVSWL
jgi:hypothetical protein